ncbi:MAG: TetR/AcrR family transcriptional regulator [Cyclobacteriaceae bacterium]
MTEKQEKILNAALALFAEEGYNTTSTNKVAKKAGVSEGLIFRHFKNKEGLLAAIMKEGEERAKVLQSDVLLESDPKEVVRKTLHLGDKMMDTEESNAFWKLQFKLKWELEYYGAEKMEPLELILANALEKLGYSNPRMEARMLLLTLEGLAMRYYLQDGFELAPHIDFLVNKYDV